MPIIGLKELPVSGSPLPHTHVQFAHCYKEQAGWSSVLSRFYRGDGILYDLEFLTDPSGRRVAAFGYHAGFAGAAAGALAYAAQKTGTKLGALEPYPNEQAMVTDVKAKLLGKEDDVKALIIGALGRCGRGAVDLFRKIGLKEYAHIVQRVTWPDVGTLETTSSNGTWTKLPREGPSRRSWMSTYLSTVSTSRRRFLRFLVENKSTPWATGAG